MKIIKLILMLGVSFFIVSCGGDSNKSSSKNSDWPASAKSQMLTDCMSEEDTTKELCQCMLDATTSEFSYKEYEALQKADEASITEEMQERALNLMMSMMECAL